MSSENHIRSEYRRLETIECIYESFFDLLEKIHMIKHFFESKACQLRKISDRRSHWIYISYFQNSNCKFSLLVNLGFLIKFCFYLREDRLISTYHPSVSYLRPRNYLIGRTMTSSQRQRHEYIVVARTKRMSVVNFVISDFGSRFHCGEKKRLLKDKNIHIYIYIYLVKL